VSRIVQPTSLDAYIRINEDNTAETQRNRVLGVLRRSRVPLTNREIATILKMEPSTVSARRNELRNLGLIRQAGRRKCRISGFTVFTWTTTDAENWRR